MILALALAVKLALAPALVERGWKGSYWFATDWTRTDETLTLKRFYERQTIRPYRIDTAIAFNKLNFALHFLNDLPSEKHEYSGALRGFLYPMRVEWVGYLRPETPVNATVTANGWVDIDVDGRQVFSGKNARAQPIPLPQLNGPATHQVRIRYTKPANTDAAVTVTGIEGVLPGDISDAALTQSHRAEIAITVAGILALLALAGAFITAHRPLTGLFLEDVWERPARMAALAFVVLFLVIGFKQNVAHRGLTMPLFIGDDFLAYEGQARQVLQNGLLMTDGSGRASPYYFYPLYSYALAGAHGLLGDDFGTIIMFNFLCIASAGPLVWLTLRGRAPDGVIIAILIVLAVMGHRHFARYATTAYSDNLYLPMVLIAIVAFIAAFERPVWWRFALVGVVTALGAATRPSFLIFFPFAVLAILVEKRLGSAWQRIRHVIAYGFGFAAGVSPFTIRNWIVSKRFVLLVASFIMVPIFLYPPGEPFPSFTVHGHTPGLIDALRQTLGVVAERPLQVLWVETRKVGFVLGLLFLGPEGVKYPSYFFVTTLLFLFALWAKRIPWAIRNVLVAFALSHIAAVVIATPWTYGYKTILPCMSHFSSGSASCCRVGEGGK